MLFPRHSTVTFLGLLCCAAGCASSATNFASGDAASDGAVDASARQKDARAEGGHDGKASEASASDGRVADSSEGGHAKDGNVSDVSASDAKSDVKVSDGKTSDGTAADGKTSDVGVSDGKTSDGHAKDGAADASRMDAGCSPACANGAACTLGGDCTSKVCTGGKCQVPTCSDGVENQNETSIDCGGVCGTCTVLVLGAGVSSTVGGEFHPGGAWAASTTLGGMSVDGLSLAMVSGGASAVGLMRFTKLGSGFDNHLQSTTWTAMAGVGAWTAFADVGATISTSNAPTVGANGATAVGAFRGFDDKYYYATFSGGAWSAALKVQPPAAGTQSTGPGAPSFDAFTGTLAFSGDNQNMYAQDFTAATGQWAAAQDVDPTNLSTLAPTVVGVSPFGTAAMLVYVRASDGQVFFSKLAAGVWSAAAVVTGALTANPVALAHTAAGAILAFRGTDAQLYYTVYAAGAWSAVTAFSTPNVTIASAPALAHGVGAAVAEIAFVEGDGALYHSRLIAGTWAAPVSVGGAGLDNVAIATAP